MGEINEAREAFMGLLDRFATALESAETPTVEDSVEFEHIVTQYWEKEKSPADLGLITRVDNKVATHSLKRNDIQSVINHCVQQKQPDNSQAFVGLIRSYLNKNITVANLLGARDRKSRNDLDWTHYDKLGEMAELIKTSSAFSLLTGNRSIANGLNDNFYGLLSELTAPSVDVDVVRKKYNLPSECDLQRIDTGFISPSQWRDYHLEFKAF